MIHVFLTTHLITVQGLLFSDRGSNHFSPLLIHTEKMMDEVNAQDTRITSDDGTQILEEQTPERSICADMRVKESDIDPAANDDKDAVPKMKYQILLS